MPSEPKISEHIAIYHRPAVKNHPSAALKLERCQAYCLSLWGSHGVVFDDAGLSGLWVNRAALDVLMKQARAGAIKIVVIHDFYAFGRTPLLTLCAVDDLLREGIEIHAVTQGGLVKSIRNVMFAEEDREARVARMKAGRERAKRARLDSK